jgi:hypothetical protein
MKKFKKVLKWIAISLLVLIIVCQQLQIQKMKYRVNLNSETSLFLLKRYLEENSKNYYEWGNQGEDKEENINIGY